MFKRCQGTPGYQETHLYCTLVRCSFSEWTCMYDVMEWSCCCPNSCHYVLAVSPSTIWQHQGKHDQCLHYLWLSGVFHGAQVHIRSMFFYEKNFIWLYVGTIPFCFTIERYPCHRIYIYAYIFIKNLSGKQSIFFNIFFFNSVLWLINMMKEILSRIFETVCMRIQKF